MEETWVGKIPWMRVWQPTPVFLPGESPWTKEPGGLQSMGSQRVRHDWVTKHILSTMGFPGGTSGKELTCQCRRHRRCGFNPWVGKIPWRRKWQPTPLFLPREFLDSGACQAIVHGVTKSQIQLKWLGTHTVDYILGLKGKESLRVLIIPLLLSSLPRFVFLSFTISFPR